MVVGLGLRAGMVSPGYRGRGGTLDELLAVWSTELKGAGQTFDIDPNWRLSVVVEVLRATYSSDFFSPRIRAAAGTAALEEVLRWR